MNHVVLEAAGTQLDLIRSRKISVRELADAHLDQIARLNPALNVFADFDPDRVRAEAARLEEMPAAVRGGLHGLPVTVKSSIAAAGFKCEVGSLLRKGEVPDEDAVVVARLRAAGALILGTTNCPEFLMAYETDNLLHGATRNPWNLGRSPGGSSGGESAAIAAGLSAAGLGSDAGGSVRVPAHFTGICSLKPTPGRLPGRGHLPPCAGPFAILGAIGPMARSVADISLLFGVLGGQDARDPASPPMPLRSLSAQALRANRIGFFEDDGIVPVTAETRAAVRSAAAALREAGFRVEPFRPRSLESLRKLWDIFFVQCGAMLYTKEMDGRRHLLSPIFREFLSIAESRPRLSAHELLTAWIELDMARGRMLAEMENFPVLLCPAAAIPAFRPGERIWKIDGVHIQYLDAVRYTQWFNTLGAPAVVVPVGQSPKGLPIGVQIAARPFEDEVALGVAAAVDAAFGYRAPPMAAAAG